MGNLHAGDKIPEFTYDTPYAAQNSFYQLLAQDERPLFLIFLRNFGHPLTRHYVVQYARTLEKLHGARLACVVRSKPQVISQHLPEGSLPYTLICDAEGVLYDFVGVKQAGNRFTAYSLTGLRILKAAQRQGFHEDKNAPQQLPLTLLLGREGQVLLAHYGASVTDQPESGVAMQTVLEAREKQLAKLEAQAAKKAKRTEKAERPAKPAKKSGKKKADTPPQPTPAEPAADAPAPESEETAPAPVQPQPAAPEAEGFAMSFAAQPASAPQPAPEEQAPQPAPEQPEAAPAADEEAIRKYGGVAAALFADDED